jgi:type 1 fimbriae regulatory protein FimB/type 1 fimbriae regulatory protein FimE
MRDTRTKHVVSRTRALSQSLTTSEVRNAEGKNLPPRRVPNKAVRSREYLTTEEVDNLIRAATRVGRHGHRDAALILIAYRHGLRVGELVSLRWDQVDFTEAVLHVTRSKNGTASNHPIGSVETRAFRRLRRDYAQSPYVFVTERKGRMTDANVRKVLARAGRLAGLPCPVHPHMLRHACGYKLANEGRDTRAIQHYLGHRNIVHTVRYTELASDRFKGFWSD